MRRQRLVEIARDVFAVHGYAGTSLAELAKRADVSKAALLHHFQSKETLYLAVLSRTVADLGALVARAGIDRGDFAERLDRLGATVVDYFGEHPTAARLLLSELIGRGPFGRGPGASQVDGTLHAVAGFLRAGMEAGAFRPQSPQQLTMSIVGLHLVYFAAHDITTSFIGEDLVASAPLAERKAAVIEQVRALCLND